MEKNLLTPQEVADKLGIKKRTFLERIATKPDFPARIAISKRIFYWNNNEVENWLFKQQETRPAAKINW